MKRIVFLLALLLGLTACEKEKHPRVTSIDDMIFIVDPLNASINPDVNMEAESNSSLDLYVARNAFIAMDYPNQDATLVVDEDESTAIYGKDFELSATTFKFRGADTFRLPLKIEIGDAAGKNIVLRLVYDEYPSCPKNGRNSDRFEITIK